jgi:hypothetical protein
MAMLRKPRVVTVILASTVGLCGGLAIFFFVQGLDRSGQYSSVLALFVSIIVAGESYVARRREPSPPSVAPAQTTNIGGHQIIVNAGVIENYHGPGSSRRKRRKR